MVLKSQLLACFTAESESWLGTKGHVCSTTDHLTASNMEKKDGIAKQTSDYAATNPRRQVIAGPSVLLLTYRH
jgi:hypothetical protein